MKLELDSLPNEALGSWARDLRDREGTDCNVRKFRIVPNFVRSKQYRRAFRRATKKSTAGKPLSSVALLEGIAAVRSIPASSRGCVSAQEEPQDVETRAAFFAKKWQTEIPKMAAAGFSQAELAQMSHMDRLNMRLSRYLPKMVLTSAVTLNTTDCQRLVFFILDILAIYCQRHTECLNMS